MKKIGGYDMAKKGKPRKYADGAVAYEKYLEKHVGTKIMVD